MSDENSVVAPHSEYDIDITATAASKSFRMMRPYGMEAAIRGLKGTLWKRASGPGANEEYHLELRKYVIVLYVNHDKQEIAVPTQMHKHIDYPTAQDFERAPHIYRP